MQWRVGEKGQFAVILLQSSERHRDTFGSEDCSFLVEEIWVSAAEGAEITGYNHDHVRRLARENWRLPEDQRRIRVRMEGQAYAIWLPDLINYFVGNNIRAANPDEEIWVNIREGAEITGYSRQYILNLAMEMQKTPEEEREVKVKKRSFGYELWLPDLLVHRKRMGRGPRKKHKQTS
jgi:hypothetical protein